jgi:hypothetical protein
VKTGSLRDGRDRKARRIRAAVALAPFALAVLVPLACSDKAALSGPGEECFAATDCQAGLVCVPQRTGSRLCSNDLTQVEGRPPPEAGADAGEAGDGPTEGGVMDGPVQDTSMPDTSKPDTSTGMDAAEGG